MANMIPCPICGKQIVDSSTKCMRCNNIIPRDANGTVVYAPPRTTTPVNNQPGYWSKPENKAVNSHANVVGDSIVCPGCGSNLPATVKKCMFCGTQIQQQINTVPMMQPNPNVTNENMIQCPACFNYMGRYAESCPYCGTPRQKKVANPMLLDAISVFALAFAVFAYIAHNTGFASAVMVIDWLIYAIYYCAIKDNKDIDSSKVKQSLITISILFFLTFGISFVVTITFR